MIVDLFAGPGGWDVGLRSLNVGPVLGVELDGDACATRQAAGFATVQADVAALDPLEVAGGPVGGLVASPPCQAWSMAGKRTAQADQGRCHRHALACQHSWTPYEPDCYADPRTPLVHEPLRWAWALRPRWVALEQVPTVLGYWNTVAHVLGGWGYNAWAGVLNAADYGVPQTRHRAFLLASLDGPAGPPEPTHAKHPQGAGLLGGGRLPWVTMARALGWGDEEPSPTVTGGGSATGGAEPYGRRSRARLASRRDSPAWIEQHGERPNRGDNEPAPSITGEAHRWAWERPATSVCADPRVPEPGWRGNPDDYADGNPTRSGDNAVRVTVQEAAILQGFPPDYSWQGSKTSRFAQVGNAVPPPLAAAVCAQLVTPQAKVGGDA